MTDSEELKQKQKKDSVTIKPNRYQNTKESEQGTPSTIADMDCATESDQDKARTAGQKRERKSQTTLKDRRQRTMDGYVVPDTLRHWGGTRTEKLKVPPLDSNLTIVDNVCDVSEIFEMAEKPHVFECNAKNPSSKKPQTNVGRKKPRKSKGLIRGRKSTASVLPNEDNQNPPRDFGPSGSAQIIAVENSNPHSVALSCSLEHDKGIVFI